jgi:hypothetical protein
MRAGTRLYPLHLHAVREVRHDAMRLAIARQCRHGLVDAGLLSADDDRGAAACDDIGRHIAPHATAATDDHQFLTFKVRTHAQPFFAVSRF